MSGYPSLKDFGEKVTYWGPGVYSVRDHGEELRIDGDAALRLASGGAGLTPDGWPTTIAALAIGFVEGSGDEDQPMTVCSVELTPMDCLQLIARLTRVADRFFEDYSEYVTREQFEVKP